MRVRQNTVKAPEGYAEVRESLFARFMVVTSMGGITYEHLFLCIRRILYVCVRDAHTEHSNNYVLSTCMVTKAVLGKMPNTLSGSRFAEVSFQVNQVFSSDHYCRKNFLQLVPHLE